MARTNSNENPIAEGKGTNFLGVLGGFERLKGKAALEAALALLPPEIEHPIRYGQILSMGWYSVHWYQALLEAFCKSTNAWGFSLVRTLARQGTAEDFQRFHGIVLRLLSTKTVTRHVPRLMQLYWRGGSAQSVDLEDGVTVLLFTGWKGFSPIVWEDIAGSSEAIIDLSGGKGAQARVAHLGAGGADAEIEVRWRNS